LGFTDVSHLSKTFKHYVDMQIKPAVLVKQHF
jgi:AraC-like DNA-binding protein